MRRITSVIDPVNRLQCCAEITEFRLALRCLISLRAAALADYQAIVDDGRFTEACELAAERRSP